MMEAIGNDGAAAGPEEKFGRIFTSSDLTHDERCRAQDFNPRLIIECYHCSQLSLRTGGPSPGTAGLLHKRHWLTFSNDIVSDWRLPEFSKTATLDFIMNAPPLHRDDQARVVAALVALDWMEFPFEISSRAVVRLLGCSPSEAMAIWKALREQQFIELTSRFDGKLPGRPVRSEWKWLEKTGSLPHRRQST
jgi:hypothetical protein